MFGVERFYQDRRLNIAALVTDHKTIHVDDDYWNEVENNPLTSTAIYNAKQGHPLNRSQFVDKIAAHIRYCQEMIIELQKPFQP